MRTFLIAAAFSVACLAPCCADDTSDGRHDDRLANSREGGAASAFSPAQLKELEQILHSVLSRARANDGDSRNENIKFQFVVHDDEEKPREPGDGQRRDGRHVGDRGESGQREHEGAQGEARDEGRYEADHGPHPGPGQGPAGGQPHATPGEHPPHTITLHIYVHHDSGGGSPPATQHGMVHGSPREMHRSDGPPSARHWTHHGRAGETHHAPHGHRDYRRRESDDHAEGDKEKSADNMQSLRDDVDCLRKELEHLSRHVRKLAHEGH